MQSPPVSQNCLPMRSPTPPLDSSSDDLNDLDQELARLDDTEAKRPHFLDYNPVPPPDLDNLQQPVHPCANDILTNGAQHMNGSSKSVNWSTSNIDKLPDVHGAGSSTKKHFLDENPIPPDYDYERHHRSLDREHDRIGRNEIYKLKYERRHSIERAKQQKKPKEPSYALSRFLATNDDRVNNAVGHREILDKSNEYGGNNFVGAGERLGTKIDHVYSLLSMMGRNNAAEMSGKFFELSKMPGTCSTLRGCIPWLVTTIHLETDEVARKQARQALHNVVNHQPDDKAGRREAKVLRHIEQIMDYCDSLKQTNNESPPIDSDSHPLQAMSSLMKVSIQANLFSQFSEIHLFYLLLYLLLWFR